MSAFLSRVDKTTSQGYFEIDLNKDHSRPMTIKMVLITGVKGEKKSAEMKDGQEHVAFHFNYKLNRWDEVARFNVPKGAAKILK